MIGETLQMAMLDAAVDVMAGGVEVRMHTGDPGPAGTANVLVPGNGYAHLTGVTFARVLFELRSLSVQVLGPRTGGGNVTLSHFSAWKDGDGAVLVTGELVEPVVYQVNGLPPGIPVGGLMITVG